MYELFQMVGGILSLVSRTAFFLPLPISMIGVAQAVFVVVHPHYTTKCYSWKTIRCKTVGHQLAKTSLKCMLKKGFDTGHFVATHFHPSTKHQKHFVVSPLWPTGPRADVFREQFCKEFSSLKRIGPTAEACHPISLHCSATLGWLCCHTGKFLVQVSELASSQTIPTTKWAGDG